MLKTKPGAGGRADRTTKKRQTLRESVPPRRNGPLPRCAADYKVLLMDRLAPVLEAPALR